MPPAYAGDLRFRNKALSVVSAAGAQEVPLPPNGSIIYPKEQSDATFTWLSPNVAITDSDKSTGELTLTAKRAPRRDQCPCGGR